MPTAIYHPLSDQTDPKVCAKCVFDRLKRNAEERGCRIELRKAPMNNNPHGVAMYEFKKGKRAGVWVRWFPARPIQCMCPQLNPIVNRSGETWEHD